MSHSQISTKHASIAGIIMTLGIVFGDIGTSPLYVMQSIIGGASHVDENFILGALSCIIFTLTLQTTIKYVIITLRADNHGEGGIFSLFALIRRIFPWTFIFAIIGGTTLLADGIITPAITVVTAVEGLELYSPGIEVVPITIAIIAFLFLIQQFGTHRVGKSFGPIMFFWFMMLAVLGALHISSYPSIIKAFNPYYAIHFLTYYPNAYILLGAVFLCTTGAEALYSDLGHCGAANIRISWIYVKITLIINYLGQGAWILNHQGFSGNPFFAIMPNWFLLVGVTMSTFAAIIASQALISGSFTLISEAISLNFWPKLKKIYPSYIKGQVYIPAVNWFLLVGCILVVLIFQKSTRMEAAYGLSITITMLMTTTLLLFYLYSKHIHISFIVIVGVVYVFIESNFLIANLYKFIHGGWFTILLAALFFLVMYGWYSARKIRNRYLAFVKLDDYAPVIAEMSRDIKIPKYSSHLAFLTHANRKDEIEKKIVFSILNKKPKRADVYWFLHVDILDDPDTFEYDVVTIIPGIAYKVNFHLGFKTEPRINMYFNQVLNEMKEHKEIDLTSKYNSLRNFGIDADFAFVVTERIFTFDMDFSLHDKFIVGFHKFLKYLGISEAYAYGLDMSNVVTEKIPISEVPYHKRKIKRISSKR